MINIKTTMLLEPQGSKLDIKWKYSEQDTCMHINHKVPNRLIPLEIEAPFCYNFLAIQSCKHFANSGDNGNKKKHIKKEFQSTLTIKVMLNHLDQTVIKLSPNNESTIICLFDIKYARTKILKSCFTCTEPICVTVSLPTSERV